MKYKAFLRRLTAVLCTLALLITSAAALSVEDARALLEEVYIDELPPAAYEAATLDELFAAVGDPYTYYMTAEEYESFLTSVEQETSVTGIGAMVQFSDDGILLTGVLSGGGAEAAGLQGGDTIIAIEGVACAPGSEAHRDLLLGEEGTFVTVTVRHSDGTEENATIRRSLVEIHNTSVTLWDGGIGYIDCDSFGSDTYSYFSQGIRQHKASAHLWVVDLRSNTGGLSSAAILSTGAFTGPQVMLHLRDNAGHSLSDSNPIGALTDQPVIVLTNSSSASASEIFAANIRDSQTGIIVGSRTHGKGVAQVVFDETNSNLFDGDAVKITAYRFYSADGNTNDKIGVIPTLLVSSGVASEVAKLLGEDTPRRSSGFLMLTLNGQGFYVDLEKAAKEENRDAFSALLAALPPDANVALGGSLGWSAITAAQLMEQYGDSTQSRWFDDVADSPCAEAINTLGTYSILLGEGSGRFSPADGLTRAQLCAMMTQALGITYSGPSQFDDVADSAWYAGAVNAMAVMGLVNGTGDEKFSPNDTLTQEQFITFMGRLAAYLNLHIRDYMDELDAEALADNELLAEYASWAKAGADTLSQTVIRDGQVYPLLHSELEDIDPQATVTREEAAQTLCNLLKGVGILSY